MVLGASWYWDVTLCKTSIWWLGDFFRFRPISKGRNVGRKFSLEPSQGLFDDLASLSLEAEIDFCTYRHQGSKAQGKGVPNHRKKMDNLQPGDVVDLF